MSQSVPPVSDESVPSVPGPESGSTPSSSEGGPVLGRRAVLATGAVVGVAGALAACGSGGPGEGKTGPVTVAADEVPVGGGFVFREQQVVVTQPEAGTYHAFSAVCPHEGCLVSEVKDDRITCPCHHSVFDASTGAHLEGPAPKGLTPRTVSVAGPSLTVG